MEPSMSIKTKTLKLKLKKLKEEPVSRIRCGSVDIWKRMNTLGRDEKIF